MRVAAITQGETLRRASARLHKGLGGKAPLIRTAYAELIERYLVLKGRAAGSTSAELEGNNPASIAYTAPSSCD